MSVEPLKDYSIVGDDLRFDSGGHGYQQQGTEGTVVYHEFEPGHGAGEYCPYRKMVDRLANSQVEPGSCNHGDNCTVCDNTGSRNSGRDGAIGASVSGV